jgi:hypothetical protein
MARFAESKYGEQPVAKGVFQTGDTVTIEVFDCTAPLAGPLTLTDNACDEVERASPPHTGVFVWNSSNFQTQPTDFTQLFWVMSNTASSPRQHIGAFTIGGYPSDSARGQFRDGFVYVDTVSGTDSEVFPYGTEQFPCKTLANVDAIVSSGGTGDGLSKIKLRGALTIDSDHINWSFDGYNPVTDVYTIQAGSSVAGSRFERSGIRGDITGAIVAEQCLIGLVSTTTTGVQGTFTECGFDGTIQLAGHGTRIQGLVLASQGTDVLTQKTYLDFNNYVAVVLGVFSGLWEIQNVSGAAIITFGMDRAILELASTVNGGNFTLVGDGEFVDNSTSTQTLVDGIRRGTRMNQIWDGMVGTREVNEATDPWQLLVRKGDDDSTTSHSFELVGNTGDINNSNPLTQYIKERNRI